MKKELSVKEQWENATLANNFIFYKVMRYHPDACRRLLEMLLNIKIEKVSVSTEETISVDINAKGIRLDVFVKDSKRIFDVEMQVIDTKDLPERARYYQSAIDVDNLWPGEPYKNLKDTHIIFLCMSDIFHKGLPVYTFENVCMENHQILLNDRTWKHFFCIQNCAKMLKDDEVRAFFKLILDNQPESKFTNELCSYIEDAKHNIQWRRQYMIWSNSIIAYKEIAREEGLAEGRAEGRKTAILESAVLAVQMGLKAEAVAEKFGVSLSELNEALSDKHLKLS